MPAFDRLQLGASADDLVWALTEAARTANQRCRVGLLRADEPTFRQAQGPYTDTPEGSAAWVAGAATPAQHDPNQRATLVGAAWWTDALGRKHLRVVGRRLEPGNLLRTNRFGPTGADWPPLGLVYPDRVVVRTRPAAPGRREVLGVCACGAVGPPESLGWMGDCCGACHDRQEEGRPARPAPGMEESGTRWLAADLGGVAYTAKGELVYADLAGGITCSGHIDSLYVGHVADSLAFACNGRVAGLAGYVGHCLWDADTGRPLCESEALMSDVRMALAISPDGTRVADTGMGGSALWEVKGKQWKQRVDYDRSEGCSVAFNPVGQEPVEGKVNGDLGFFDARYPLTVRPGHALRALAFSPDGKVLAVGTGSHPFQGGPDVPGELHLLAWDGGRNPPTRQADATHAGSVQAVAFSPDGAVLASAGADRTVRLWDVASARLLLTLEWHWGPVRGVAFSPDGQELASASADGAVRLWPWRDFLPG